MCVCLCINSLYIGHTLVAKDDTIYSLSDGSSASAVVRNDCTRTTSFTRATQLEEEPTRYPVVGTSWPPSFVNESRLIASANVGSSSLDDFLLLRTGSTKAVNNTFTSKYNHPPDSKPLNAGYS